MPVPYFPVTAIQRGHFQIRDTSADGGNFMKMKVFFILVLTLLITGPMASPPAFRWQAQFPGTAKAMTATPDHGFAITGQGAASGVLVTRLDSLGRPVWTKTYGANSTGKGIVRTPDNGFAIVALEGAAFRVLRLNSAGDTLWTRLAGDSSGNQADGGAIIATRDHGFAVCGTLKRTFMSSTYYSARLFKLDSSGVPLFSRSFSDDAFYGSVGGLSIAEDGKGNLAFCGGGTAIKTDSAGNLLTSKEYTTWVTGHGFYGNSAVSIAPAMDSGFIICGTALDPDYFTTISNLYTNIWFSRLYPASLNTAWTRTIGRIRSQVEEGQFAGQTLDRGYVVGGMYKGSRFICDTSGNCSGSSYNSGWFGRTDSAGNLTWSILDTFRLSGAVLSAIQTPDSGFAALGSNALVKYGFDFAPPRFSPVSDTTATAGLYFRLNTPATYEAAPLTVRFLVKPRWLQLHASAPYYVYGTPAAANEGDTLFSLEASDGEGRCDTLNVQIRVLPDVGVETAAHLPALSITPLGANPGHGIYQFRLITGFATDVDVAVFRADGRRVATLASGVLTQGIRDLSWKAERIPAGIYIIRARAGRLEQRLKLAIIR